MKIKNGNIKMLKEILIFKSLFSQGLFAYLHLIDCKSVNLDLYAEEGKFAGFIEENYKIFKDENNGKLDHLTFISLQVSNEMNNSLNIRWIAAQIFYKAQEELEKLGLKESFMEEEQVRRMEDWSSTNPVVEMRSFTKLSDKKIRKLLLQYTSNFHDIDLFFRKADTEGPEITSVESNNGKLIEQ